MELYKTKLINERLKKFCQILLVIQPWRDELKTHINLLKEFERKDTKEYIHDIKFIIKENLVLISKIKKIKDTNILKEINKRISSNKNNITFGSTAEELSRMYSFNWQVNEAHIKIDNIEIPDIWVAKDWRYLNSNIYRFGIKDFNTTYFPKGTYGIEVEVEDTDKENNFKSKVYGGSYKYNYRYLVDINFLNKNLDLNINEDLNEDLQKRILLQKNFNTSEGWILLNKQDWKKINNKIILI